LIKVFFGWFIHGSSNMRSHPPQHVILSDVRRQPNKSKDPVIVGIGIDYEKFSTTEQGMNRWEPYPNVVFFATLGWERNCFSK
jgi:hypothetical protein